METGDPPTGWNLNGAGATVAANADAHGGTQSALVTRGASAYVLYRDSEATSVGVWYALTGWTHNVDATSIQYFLQGGATEVTGAPNSDTSWVQSAVTARATAIAMPVNCIINGAVGKQGMYDDISLKPLTLASLFSSVTDAKTSDALIDVKVAALTSGTQAGLVVRLDSATSPANFVICYFNGAGSVVVDECVAGTYTNIMAAVVKAFTAGDTLRVSAIGTALRIYHVTAAGVATLLGTATTAVATGNRFGLFSTFVSNTFSQVQVFPIGSGAEWEALSSL
jgi:hypothetical protein